jgi:serine/threonine protein kinase
MINTTIAHYKITAKLGQGGMGEVYQATDTKLGREVAIKVLPEDLDNPSQMVEESSHFLSMTGVWQPSSQP